MDEFDRTVDEIEMSLIEIIERRGLTQVMEALEEIDPARIEERYVDATRDYITEMTTEELLELTEKPVESKEDALEHEIAEEILQQRRERQDDPALNKTIAQAIKEAQSN
jgi:hypothetical protein